MGAGAPDVQTRFCRQCGAKVPVTDRFCAACGAEQPRGPGDPDRPAGDRQDQTSPAEPSPGQDTRSVSSGAGGLDRSRARQAALTLGLAAINLLIGGANSVYIDLGLGRTVSDISPLFYVGGLFAFVGSALLADAILPALVGRLGPTGARSWRDLGTVQGGLLLLGLVVAALVLAGVIVAVAFAVFVQTAP